MVVVQAWEVMGCQLGSVALAPAEYLVHHLVHGDVLTAELVDTCNCSHIVTVKKD